MPQMSPIIEIIVTILVLGTFGNLLRIFAYSFKNTDALVRVYHDVFRNVPLPTWLECGIGGILAGVELASYFPAQGIEGPITSSAGVWRVARTFGADIQPAIAGAAAAAFATLFGGRSLWLVPTGVLFAVEFFGRRPQSLNEDYMPSSPAS